MRSFILMCAVATLAMFAFAPSAPASVITFDDLPGAHVPIPDGYGGLQWSDYFWYLDGTNMPFSGYFNGIVSPNNVAYSAFEEDVWVDEGSTFDFNGAWLTAAWNDNLNITVEGWLLGSLVYSQTVVPLYTGPTWFQFDYLGIDHLTFNSFGGTDHDYYDSGAGEHFVMDNMVIEGTRVPAPTALISLLTGLACLTGLKRTWRGIL